MPDDVLKCSQIHISLPEKEAGVHPFGKARFFSQAWWVKSRTWTRAALYHVY